jgi:mono/diheme cytochrome c family protein
MWRLTNIFLGFAFVASLGVHMIATRDRSQPNFEFLPNMAHSPAYDSLSANPNFSDGMTLRLPEPGTIARGRLPLHYEPTPQDAIRAGDELHNPFASNDTQARKRGAFIFANYCQMCHGPEGKGDGVVPQRGIPPAASLQADRTVQLKDGQLFHILTYGQGNMSSHAVQLSRDDRWKVILHIRSLQQAGGTKP